MSDNQKRSSGFSGSKEGVERVERHHRIVRTFMTQGMADDDILNLATGRARELERILGAVERSRNAAPGTLQHLVLYGNRGFGKSFMTRRVEIEVARRYPEIPFLLLPEEQHSLQRDSFALLETIALMLEDNLSGGDTVYAQGHFRWPTAEEAADRWRMAETNVERALDAASPSGGIAVVVVENFDVLLQRLFREELEEQRLRRWLDRRGNRLMMFATATGTVDMNYDRPLFHAFESVRLEPWSSDDCIAYFNRLRAHQRQERLGPEREAKARAVADFIGGNPRLAQLLSDVLETDDALEVAEIMSALTDRLADYYRRRIEDLAPLSIGLLDALIRGGEPASQTELAARVGAKGQPEIARVMGELQRADIVRGTSAPDTREKLYRVPDRVFVHYYRLRQGSRTALKTPLVTILDFLRSFYSHDERRQQSLTHLDAGRFPEAGLFSRLSREGTPQASNRYTRLFADNLRLYLTAAQGALGRSAEDIAAMLDGETPEDAYELSQGEVRAGVTGSIHAVVRAQALYRLYDCEKAKEVLESSLELAQGDATACFIVLDQLATLLGIHDKEGAASVVDAIENLNCDFPPAMESKRLRRIAWQQDRLGRHANALETATRAAGLASIAEDVLGEAKSLRRSAYSLGQLGRHEEAVEIAMRAAKLAAAADDKDEEAVSFRVSAYSLGKLGRYEEAVETAFRAANLAATAGDEFEEAICMRLSAFLLGKLGRHEEAVETAMHAAKVAAAAEHELEEALSLRHGAYSLSQLGRHEEAVTTAMRAAKLAAASGHELEEATSLRHGAYSLSRLEMHTEAWVAARRSVEIFLRTTDANSVSWGIVECLRAAQHIARPEVVELFGDWLRHSKENREHDVRNLSEPKFALSLLLIAVARANAWIALDDLFEEHTVWLAERDEMVWFSSELGEGFAQIGKENGRAAGYEAMAEALPRIAKLMERLPQKVQDHTWLPEIATGFAMGCRDPGLLRDVASLLTPELSPLAKETADLFTRLAEVDEAAAPEMVLARIDPDIATLIRLLRKLPDLGPPPPSKKARTANRR